MRPPDKIPGFKLATFKPGDDAYLWTGTRYSPKTVVSSHDWKNAMTVQDGIGKMQVGGHQVISAEQFKDEQREEARAKYDWIITHWNNGARTSKDIAAKTGESARSIGQMIAAAKRWGLIVPDKEPDAKPPTD